MKKFIIYGAGKVGKNYYNFFKENNLEDMIFGYCDLNYSEIKSLGNKKVYSYDEAKKFNLPFIIAIFQKRYDKQALINQLKNDNMKIVLIEDLYQEFGYQDRVSFNRELCAFSHKKFMDFYFDDAENLLDIFWDEKTVFKKYFDKLDLTNVIELACGRGRHVQKYTNKASNITLVDILQKNIDYCKDRFSEHNNINYYCNNGYNLCELEDEKYTSLFSYDAIVHFEMMDIYSYLKDIYRVLVPGGKVLIHHSNNSRDYKASYTNAPSSRAFMSKELFAHIAYKCGFTVLEQSNIDWNNIPDLDCVTLLLK